MNHEQHQSRFYHHLKMHPGAHRAAVAFIRKLIAKDPTAIACLKDLVSRASHDASAANALRILAVTAKYEFPGHEALFAGGVPGQVFHAGKNVLKLALSPAAWGINAVGKVFHWGGSQLHHLAHII